MKKHDVNIVVLNVFLEQTKKTGHYLKVFCTFCHPLGIERILRLFHAPAQYLEMSSSSPFKRCKCFNDIIDALDNVKFEFAHRTNSTNFVETDLDIQEQVIYATNTLLHHTIGSKNVDGREVAEIGQGIFNESCRRILGDDFKDVTESPEGADTIVLEQLEQQRKNLIALDRAQIEDVIRRMAIRPNLNI